MTEQNEITDMDFISFLHNLGVETYDQSFEWMLNDPAFSDVLRWIYNNVDSNNALSAREECRYLELEKKGALLSKEELESAVLEIQKEYEGICLPGDQHGIEDVQLDIQMQKERLEMLEKQEEAIQNMIRHNESLNEQLDKEIAKLQAAEMQCTKDGATLAQDCMSLAEQAEATTNEVIEAVGDTLNIYSNCHEDKAIAKRFLAYGPFETYRNSQALFRSHFDLYVTKKLEHNDNVKEEEDMQSALEEAKNMESRLLHAITEYIESKSELSGEQAKLALVANFSNVHPSQITVLSTEAQSEIVLLEEEEAVLEQQLQMAARQLVDRRTSLVDDAIANNALAVRVQIHNDLKYLYQITQKVLSLDKILYCALKQELGSIEELVHFAAHFKSFLMQEEGAVLSRIQYMNDICTEQEQAERMLALSDGLLNSLSSILGVEADAVALVKADSALKSNIFELNENIVEKLKEKENELVPIKKQQEVLSQHIWGGSSKHPNCFNTSLSRMLDGLLHEIAEVDSSMVQASAQFTAMKNEDKKIKRKLWQWFLTDQAKLMSIVRNVTSHQ